MIVGLTERLTWRRLGRAMAPHGTERREGYWQ